MTRAVPGMLLLAALALTACRSELPSSVESTLSGSYALITLNGSRVPVTRQLGGETETIESGFIEFESTRTFRHELHFSVQTATGTEAQISTQSGIWVQYPDAVQLNYTGAARAVIGRLSGNRVTIEADGDRYVFEK